MREFYALLANLNTSIYSNCRAKTQALSEGCYASLVLTNGKSYQCIGKLVSQLNLKLAS